MKKKGFTLIELLAVIVILAIIALIAIPLIGNVIEKAKIGALESSVNGLVESANMYYTNKIIKGETISETTFDFEDGEQVSTQKLEYKGKVYNGKLILHANGEIAVCIDDEEHYAYKNKDTDEIISGNGTCLYDGTTGDFSSNSGITDLRGKTLIATQIEENGDNAIITIPEEGHVDSTSKISVPIETIKSEVSSLSKEASTLIKLTHTTSSQTVNVDEGNIVLVSIPYATTSGGGTIKASHSVTNMTLLLSDSAVSGSTTSDNGRNGVYIYVYKAEANASITVTGVYFGGIYVGLLS